MPRKSTEIAVLEFTQAIGLLVRRVRAAAASHELSLTESAVMTRLDKEGPATTAELARAEGMKPQSMGATVAALEEMGMVERKPHPTDGRQILFVLTTHGLDELHRRRAIKREWMVDALAKFEPAEVEALAAAIPLIRRLGEA